MIWSLATLPLHLLDPAELVRVEDPHYPGAIASSATGALIVGPPGAGIPWRPASIPSSDELYEGSRWAALEVLEATNADLWHADGITGAGVKIAIFDIGWFGGGADPGELGEVFTHDCFVSPTCERPMDLLRPNLSLEGGVHGWACAEAIRDVAPGAEIHLVRSNSFTMLENGVDWAIREGIDVISMSMSFYNDSFQDGTGPHDRLMRKLEAADILMVTSAGNDAEVHWAGPLIDADADGRVDGDGDNGLWIYLERDTTVGITWNQFNSCGHTDLDAYVVGPGRRIIGASEDDQIPGADRCRPVESVRAVVRQPDWYRLEIVHRRGSRANVKIDVISRGGALLQPIPAGSLSDPASHPLAIAVGAVRVGNYWDGPPEPFSSQGPNSAGDPKPDISGPDGFSSDAFGPEGFYGTSASTPVVAGLLALVIEDEPQLSNREAFELLAAWARDGTGLSIAADPQLGAGRARLPIREPGAAPCGQRPLIMPLLFLPLWWRPRRR